MKSRRIEAALGIAFLATACHPVEQAALVYSSSRQIGASVVSGTPETPGLVINVGYRGLDAAYVPVAVAKYCPPESRADCTHKTYRLMQLVGKNKLGNETSTDAGRITTLNTSIGTEREAIRSIDAEIGRLTDIRNQNEIERARLPQLTNRKDQLSTAQGTDANPAELAQVEGDIRRIQALEATAAIDTRIAALRVERHQAADRQELAEKELAVRQDVRNAKNADDTTDAYSVYGSFNGSTNADTKGAGLVAGQVFSTGVASQHLTRGAREAAVVTACLSTVADISEDLATDADRLKFLPEAIAICRAGPGKPPAG